MREVEIQMAFYQVICLSLDVKEFKSVICSGFPTLKSVVLLSEVVIIRLL